jgi:sec-independent protein translocase protein TatA
LAPDTETSYIVSPQDFTPSAVERQERSRGELIMGSLSPWHILIVALIVLLVFGGRGKLSGLMGDAAKGIRAFRDGLKGEEPPPPPPAPPIARPEGEKDPVAH